MNTNAEIDRAKTSAAQSPIFTIGHSTRTLQSFCALLAENSIGRLIDVRSYPGSRKYPHFGKEALSAALAEQGIDYVHLPELGGRRRPSKENSASYWRTEGFRGYSEYMRTEAFQQGFHRAIELAHSKRSVLLCAEAVPWRCHRQLIADALVARGIQVWHILQPGKLTQHALNPHARVAADGSLIYVS